MNITDFTKIVKPFSMTSEKRIIALYESLEHIRINNINGDLVECGVWKGGNILGMMEYCHFHKMNKHIWLYDTFSGMTEPSSNDTDLFNNPANAILESVKCYCSLDDVKKNLSLSGYSLNNISYIVGNIIDTLKQPSNLPQKISLLRLDTDWYDSTLVELQVLFPILEKGGILMIDDYGHWQGCKKATDEYFQNENKHFTPIDYTGILLVK